jgi:hypothetical protein
MALLGGFDKSPGVIFQQSVYIAPGGTDKRGEGFSDEVSGGVVDVAQRFEHEAGVSEP